MGTELLGKQVDYPKEYDPGLLQGIPRESHRWDLALDENNLPFHGVDFWNGYELSWLNPSGKPNVATLELMIPCSSPKMIESKSLKLYLGSFNMTPFSSILDVIKRIETDLSAITETPVAANIAPLKARNRAITWDFKAELLDDLDVNIKDYKFNPVPLKEPARVGLVNEAKEALYSNLFRSLCPVTGQPDWATIFVRYKGVPICHQGLLKYLLSYRNEQCFHEHCIERIFMDIMEAKAPEELTVIGYFSRRGGLEINPFRSNFESAEGQNLRMSRQ